ncbi:hypothetical protein CYY_002656 [Polysphondylium violaceum]|uniref:GPI ethanolamine phosphate transferase 2 C-terminal domain-containing protein n=1 Tax=Polysphondylium violaceum TaxID=133409 RepID=A0A8J4PZU7_9MYCE|nr:hypothetical protein CYY_002656 [Polysphondylium violaceum]
MTRLQIKNKTSSYNLIIYLLFFISLLSISCYIFFTGFLLMRFELPLKSQCVQSPLPNSNTVNINERGQEEIGCWMDKTYKKAVIVVIDALRYDFVSKQTRDKKNSDKEHDVMELSEFFHNKLTCLHDLLENKSEHTLLYKFIADSPTVTMQRIKGISTGSLPTFIDVGSNFGGEAIVEDSIVHQLSFHDGQDSFDIQNNNSTFRNKVIFVGDDTWVSLFPSHFYSQYPYPSFNVKDIHTVDNGVIEHLLPTITKHSDSWDIAIAHLLGVDHIGHTYGPSHPEMIKKMDQMDQFLLSILNNIQNDTIFILMGDHGMTTDGNHGGASHLETDAALFIYSPGVKINSKDFPLDQLGLNEHQRDRHISQIDLVSTLSLLLGIPIPYGNLGTIIPELFYSSGGDGNNNNNGNWDKLLQALRINTFQIQRYIESYSKISKEFPKSKLDYFQSLLDKTETLYSNYKSSNINPIDIYKGYLELHGQIIEFCRDIWATFDFVSMNVGIGIMVLIIISIILFLFKIIRNNINLHDIKFPFKSIISTWVIGSLVSLFLIQHYQDQYPFTTLYFTTPTILALIVFIIYPYSLINNNHSNSNSNNSCKISNIFNNGLIIYIIYFIPLLSIILHGASFNSNSFIETQPNVVNFFIVSNVLLLFVALFYYQSKWNNFNVILLFIVLFSLFCTSTLFTQTLNDLSFYFGNNNSNNIGTTTNEINNNMEIYSQITKPRLWMVSMILIFLIWNKVCKRVVPTFGLFKTILLGMALLSITCFWIIIQPLTENNVQLSWWCKGFLPWIVYSSSIYFIYSSISTTPNTTETISKYILSKAIEIFLSFYLVILLLLGSTYANIMLWLLIQTISIILLISRLYSSPSSIFNSISSNSDNNNNKTDTKIFKYYFNIIISCLWGFLSIHHFFSSGHEYAISKIQFSSAFIGFEEHFIWRDGLLVLLNTFSSGVLFTFSLPILVLFAKYYKSIKTNDDEQQDNNSANSISTDLLIGYLSFLFFFIYNTLQMFICVYHLRRHLMVWRVFAPKYIFETCQLLTISVFIVLSSIVITLLQQRFAKTNKRVKVQ